MVSQYLSSVLFFVCFFELLHVTVTRSVILFPTRGGASEHQTGNEEEAGRMAPGAAVATGRLATPAPDGAAVLDDCSMAEHFSSRARSQQQRGL